MAFGADDAALVYAGAQVLGTGVNSYAQGRMNRATRQFAQEQSQVQNDRNIANWKMMNEYNEGQWNKQNAYDQQMRDNQRMYDLDMYNMENEYNSPRQQMQRFQEAGLNPHMISGSSNAMGGSVSSSNMDTQAQTTGAPSNADKAEWNPRAPQMDFHSGLMGMIDIQTKKAQQDLIATQAKLASREADLVTAKAITENATGNSAGLRYEIDSQLKQTSVDAKKEELRKLTNDANFTANQDRRAERTTEMSVQEATARIDLLKKQAKTEEQKQELNDAELVIKKLEGTYGSGLFGIPGLLGRIVNALESKYKDFDQLEENKIIYKKD